MDIRLIIAIITGKIIATIIKYIARSGATAAPGLYALKIDPNLIPKLSKQIHRGSLLVSGTNGKTTTSRLISEILSTKYRIIHNRQGSNLMRGIASTLIDKATIFGVIQADIAIWEVDEATLPIALRQTFAKTVILLNMFRDQLDRYGEVDSIREKWNIAIKILPADTNLILNANDPGMAIFGKEKNIKKIYFGIDDSNVLHGILKETSDINYCLKCYSKLVYKEIYLSHLGNFACSSCNFAMPKLSLSATKIKFNNIFSSQIEIKQYNLKLNIPLPGLYNIYNVLASVAASKTLGITNNVIKSKIENFSGAFGRFQQTNINNQKVILFLIKNPTGANEVLKVLTKQKASYLIALNDNFADGKDVSWIWDTNWEYINNAKAVHVTGQRAWDMALRLKYAGIKMSNNSVNDDINYSLAHFAQYTNNNSPHYILATYTSMLTMQKYLAKAGDNKWHHQ